jgi:hypothetical protein
LRTPNLFVSSFNDLIRDLASLSVQPLFEASSVNNFLI